MNECFFCMAVEGKVNVFKVLDTEHFIGILDINPTSKGHTLIIPKRHITSFLELNDLEIIELFDVFDFFREKVKSALKADGLQVYFANGKSANQRADHFIVHLIPTYGNNPLKYEFKKFDARELAEIASKLKTAFNSKPQD